NIAPYQVMAVQDGHIILAVGNDGQFQRLCDVLGLAGIKADARFSSNQLRVANRDALTTLLETVLAGWSRGELLAALEAATVPAGPINTVGQAFEDPQLQHRGMQISPEGIPGVRGPWKFSDAELALEKSAPKLPK
ncbi:CoA transferase, partial [Pseudophaeobacter sp.]|uniref:CoA transferase n=1 Tax=Pseudophaeobacter sp. TaxID=1971739 RepID=UPI002629A3C2